MFAVSLVIVVINYVIFICFVYYLNVCDSSLVLQIIYLSVFFCVQVLIWVIGTRKFNTYIWYPGQLFCATYVIPYNIHGEGLMGAGIIYYLVNGVIFFGILECIIMVLVNHKSIMVGLDPKKDRENEEV